MEMFLLVGGKGKCVAKLHSCGASGKAGEEVDPGLPGFMMNLLCLNVWLLLLGQCF
jgi:hypothetical protein